MVFGTARHTINIYTSIKVSIMLLNHAGHSKHGNNLNNDVCNAMSYLKPVLISQSIHSMCSYFSKGNLY